MEHHKQFSCTGMLKIEIFPQGMRGDIGVNYKNYNFLHGDWLKKKKLIFSTNSLAKLLLDSSISQSHSKLLFKSTNYIQSCSLNQPIGLRQSFGANFSFLS